MSVPLRILPVVLLLTLCVVVGCGGGAEETLVVYTPHGKELLTHYEEAFEAANPGVDVQWLDMGTEQVYDRISTERRRPQASLWWGGPNVTFNKAAREGLLEPYEPTWSDAVDASVRHPEHYWYGTYLTPEVLLFNTESIPETDLPRDWDDLLDPVWRDRIIIRYPLQSGTMRTIFAAMIMRQPTVDDGYAWLARLDQNTKTYAADPTQLYLKIARGEGDLTLWNMPDTEIQRANDYPFGLVIPASGTPVLTEGIALVAGGPNLDRARQFYEFVTTEEALLHQARENYRIPARNDLDAADLPEWITAVDVQPMEMDWDRLAAENAAWMQYWDENIKGRGAEYLAEQGMAP